MPEAFSRERLADLRIDPREDLNEIKNWLDLRANNGAKATFAKCADGAACVGRTQGSDMDLKNSRILLNRLVANRCEGERRCGRYTD
ncbi:hypothetical protein [Burkholderia cenocepacia]|uniref:hypothetical protein n=1 Tax=Burkholderia cenocepacia TaxID=95486 RepID=UPI0028B35C62|nr:hypothetical protein [Burkholderia cenocepacia]MDT6995090.1 hypothetical protein [Burkholderia cenocepacia]